MSQNRKNLTEEMSKAIVKATATIVAGYAANHKLSGGAIGTVIAEVHSALSDAAGKAAGGTGEPAVPVKDSVHPEYIVCLEDGKQLKMLKRYLKSRYGMSAEEYREKWDLSADYPMIAPNYAKKRSTLAKKSGLGKK
jgi:predicted transcriptional regulator